MQNKCLNTWAKTRGRGSFSRRNRVDHGKQLISYTEQTKYTTETITAMNKQEPHGHRGKTPKKPNKIRIQNLAGQFAELVTNHGMLCFG